MSDYYDQDLFAAESSTKGKLHICLFSAQSKLARSIIELLNDNLYRVKDLSSSKDLIGFLADNEKTIDCIIFVKDTQANSILEQLWRTQILLPTIIIEGDNSSITTASTESDSSEEFTDIIKVSTIYHRAEILLYPTQLGEINTYINLAITKFLNLAPGTEMSEGKSQVELETDSTSLISQQRRLTEKIKERLGYSGVYYQRQVSCFYRNLPPQKQKKFDRELSQSYRRILIEYFDDNLKINKLIDEFVDLAFFADVSTSQILEMHMELIDDFSHQLKIEGRNDDILLDYRLPLIDIIAHLCEMYRRSISGDDASLDLLFTVNGTQP